MDPWTSLIGPAVVAAVISGLVSSIGIWISARTARRIHSEKLAFDREEAERRFVREVGVSEAKISADTALAEKKVAFDKALAVWRRRYDLAEQVLAAAYEARDALNWARARVVMSGEGETRKAAEPESHKLREARNSAFVPIERLAHNAKAFAAVQTLRYIVAAHFGPESIKPLDAIIGIHHSITSAASILIQMAVADEDHLARQQLAPLRAALWGERPDADEKRLDEAIRQLEAICKPVLSEKVPA